MILDRDIDSSGKGKYGLVNNRRLQEIIQPRRADDDGNDESMVKIRRAMVVREAVALLEREGIIDWGLPGTKSEFFVLKLRDAWADDALFRYALSANHAGEGDYARGVEELAERAGVNSPFCKRPD